jgi:putative peptidoglycan lipid II flippase
MSAPPEDPTVPAEATGTGGSALVAAGILLSRVAGLVRERVLAQFFGTTLHADVFRAGLRMPNVLQNLLGEGTLSASFIPVYAELLEQNRRDEAGRVAGAMFALLLAVAGGVALIGVVFAPVLVSIFLPGFEGERRELTIAVTRILFPMTGVLVLSAWSLGILNSHRRFFIPYFAPVLWNSAIIATFLLFGFELPASRLVVAVAWGALLGGALQFAVQLPWVLTLEPNLRISTGRHLAGVREAVRNAGPAIVGRGVVQLSGWLDMVLASLLATGAVAAVGYAQTLYLLPVSLFGMSVAAAELPELARRRTGAGEVLRARAETALRRVVFYVLPSFTGFVLLGDVIAAALYQTGEFERADTVLVYLTLTGYSLGLLASTITRLFSSTFFALRDTRTPAQYAIMRVVTAAMLGFLLMIQFEPIEALGIGAGIFSGWEIDGRLLGAVGLAYGSGIAAWVEWALLRRSLRQRVGVIAVGRMLWLLLSLAALSAGAVAWGIRWILPPLHPIPSAAVILSGFGVTYFAVAAALGIRESRVVVRRLAALVRLRG